MFLCSLPFLILTFPSPTPFPYSKSQMQAPTHREAIVVTKTALRPSHRGTAAMLARAHRPSSCHQGFSSRNCVQRRRCGSGQRTVLVIVAAATELAHIINFRSTTSACVSGARKADVAAGNVRRTGAAAASDKGAKRATRRTSLTKGLDYSVKSVLCDLVPGAQFTPVRASAQFRT